MHFLQCGFKPQIRSIWRKYVSISVIFPILMLTIYPILSLDRSVTDLFFDKHLQVFPLKHHPFLMQWMHTNLKWMIVFTALLSLLASVTAYWVPILKPYQRALFWVGLGMVVSTSTVAIFKHYNQHGCPWDLAIYGGDLPFFELLADMPFSAGAGHCFPAGHPSGGFALLAFYFAFMHSKPRFAHGMLWLGLFTGLLMGLVQVVRGAHFLSHVLWSGWVVWVSLLILYCLWPPNAEFSVNQ